MKLCRLCLIEKPDDMFGKNRTECKPCNTAHYRSYRKNYFDNRKRKVMEHYGNKCMYCGESDINKLQIDHIHGNGKAHRIEMNGGKKDGKILYKWIIDHDYPEGFQVLCVRHNFSKHNMTDDEYRQFIIDTYNYIRKGL